MISLGDFHGQKINEAAFAREERASRLDNEARYASISQ